MSIGPAFNRLWSANIFTNLADGVGKTALPLLAVSLTKDPVLISLTGALVMLPWLLFAIPIGAIIDNSDKRLALATANAIRLGAVAFLSLLITVDRITIHWLLLIIFIYGTCEVVADTTSQTLIPSVVPEKELERANSRLEMSFTVFQDFVGAPIGGLLYAIAIAAPFIANSLGYLVATIICLTIPLQFTKKETIRDLSRRQRFVDDIKVGFHFLWTHSDLRRIVITTTVIGFCWSFSSSTTILYLIQDLGMDPKKYGFMMTAFGLFALAGATSAPKSAQRWGRGSVLALAITLSSAMMIVTSAVPNVWWYLLPTLTYGFCLPHWNILLMATYQRLIPKDLYGRVHGTRRTLVWGMMPIASFLGGVVAKINLRLPWLIGGVVATVVAIASWKFITRLGDSAVSING